LVALAKIVTKTNRELAGNTEKFASEIGLPEEYNHMQKIYIDFGCKYRHAPAMREITSSPLFQEQHKRIMAKHAKTP
jgi:hypothetical protein